MEPVSLRPLQSCRVLFPVRIFVISSDVHISGNNWWTSRILFECPAHGPDFRLNIYDMN